MTHCDFWVRRVVVLRALQWLITNNQYYCALGVTIDSNALEQLPQDENVANLTYVTETTKHQILLAVRALRFLLSYGDKGHLHDFACVRRVRGYSMCTRVSAQTLHHRQGKTLDYSPTEY